MSRLVIITALNRDKDRYLKELVWIIFIKVVQHATCEEASWVVFLWVQSQLIGALVEGEVVAFRLEAYVDRSAPELGSVIEGADNLIVVGRSGGAVCRDLLLGLKVVL